MTDSAVPVACCKGNRTGSTQRVCVCVFVCVESSARCIVNWAPGPRVGHAWLRQSVQRISPRALGLTPHTPVYLWWTQWHWRRFLYECVGFPLSVTSPSRHPIQCYIVIHPFFYFIFVARQAQWVRVSSRYGFNITTDTPHLVGLLWTSDQPDSETSTWPTHNTHNRHMHIWDSNPQSQEVSGLRLMPWTARSPTRLLRPSSTLCVTLSSLQRL